MESPQVPEVNETAGDLPSGPGEVTRAPAGDGEGFRQLLELYSRFMQDTKSPVKERGYRYRKIESVDSRYRALLYTV